MFLKVINCDCTQPYAIVGQKMCAHSFLYKCTYVYIYIKVYTNMPMYTCT